jgi:hypothetical protein
MPKAVQDPGVVHVRNLASVEIAEHRSSSP